MSGIDPQDRHEVAEKFNIAPVMAAEIVFINDDEWYGNETPERRFVRVRQWVVEQIKQESAR